MVVKFSQLKTHATINVFSLKKRIRLTDDETIMKLQDLNTCKYIYIQTVPNHIFNSILCTFLDLLQSVFPITCKNMKEKN
jgi:hypothetical protein